MAKKIIDKEQTEKAAAEEKIRRKRLFRWAVFVIVINALQLIFRIWLIQVFAMIGTVYALYRMVVVENVNNRFSSKYYDWAGQPLSRHKANNH
ncbi:hypothetical protein [Lactobacillus psittaci]|nr:hypothetical protein [Lactobacillus psittaci]